MNGRQKKKPSEMHVKKAANGGYIVRHSYDNQGAGESYTPPQEHAFSSHKAMLAHVGSTMADNDGDEGPGTEAAPTTHGLPAGKASGAGRPTTAKPNVRSGRGLD